MGGMGEGPTSVAPGRTGRNTGEDGERCEVSVDVSRATWRDEERGAGEEKEQQQRAGATELEVCQRGQEMGNRQESEAEQQDALETEAAEQRHGRGHTRLLRSGRRRTQIDFV